MISRSELDRLDRAQSEVIRRGQGQLRGVFSSLPLDRPESARDALLEAYPAVVLGHGDLASTVAAEWYEDQRLQQRGGRYTAVTASPPREEKLTGAVRFAAAGLFAEDALSTLRTLEGSLTRSLGDAQRDTINENVRRDRDAAGWHRIAHADGCDFCVMLSQRGAIYRRATADFASHDNCRCKAAPSWDRSAPEVSVRAYEASDRMESVRRRANDPSLSPEDRAKAQRQLDRHSERTREWINANRSMLDDFRAELL